MPREITVILKQPGPEPQSSGRRVWLFLNGVVKAPLFVFLFGASIATIFPAIRAWFTPADERERTRIEVEARADATLIAPFLANLNANEPGKFWPTKAALKAIQDSSVVEPGGKARPVFEAVNRAIDEVAKELFPKPSETLTAAATQELQKRAEPVASSGNVEAVYAGLESAVVYIEVSRENADQQKQADKLLQDLRSRRVVAPGVEKLAKATMPQKTQVRYYYDSDRAMAEDLAGVVKAMTNSDVYIVKLDLKAKERTLELWFGQG